MDTAEPGTGGPTIISAQDVTLRYGERRALDGFTLDIPREGVFGLLGPNGSGKSTFLTMVAAAEPPPAGSLRLFGTEPSATMRARMGTVFQENTADPLMTPREYLELMGRLFGLGRRAAATRGDILLGRFALADRRDTPVSTLSGGMRRRLEIARALLHGPELLLLDEPTTGVDADERKSFWSGLREGAEARTIVLATNDLVEADTVCDRVAFVRAGAIVAEGTPAALKRDLRNETVRVAWESPSDEALALIEGWPGTGHVVRDAGEVRVTVDDAAALVPRLFELAPGQIRAVEIHRSTLEDAYFQHVGVSVRRAEEAPAR